MNSYLRTMYTGMKRVAFPVVLIAAGACHLGEETVGKVQTLTPQYGRNNVLQSYTLRLDNGVEFQDTMSGGLEDSIQKNYSKLSEARLKNKDVVVRGTHLGPLPGSDGRGVNEVFSIDLER